MSNKHTELIQRLRGFMRAPREAQSLCLEAAVALEASESAAAPVAFADWRAVLAEKVDAYIQQQSEEDNEDLDRLYTELKSHILNTPFATQPQVSAAVPEVCPQCDPEQGLYCWGHGLSAPQPPAPVSAKPLPLTDEHVPAVYQLALCEIQRLVKENFGRMPQGVWPGKVLGVRDAIEAAYNIKEQP